MDFNLSESPGPSQFASGALIGGTLPYMAPEQLQKFSGKLRSTDKAADVYSLGLVLFELLTGRLPTPLPAGDANAVLRGLIAARSSKPAPVNTLNRDVSPALAAIVARCLAPDPFDRYPSAVQLLEDLTRQRRSLPLRYAPEPSMRERWAKWARRHPRLTSAGSVAAMAMTLLVGVGLAGWRIEQQRTELSRQRTELSQREQGRLWAGDFRAARLALYDVGNAPEARERGLAAATCAWERIPHATGIPLAERGELASLAAAASRTAAR